MKLTFIILPFYLVLTMASVYSQESAALTPEQIEKILAEIDSLEERKTSGNKSLNQTAAVAFFNASKSPKAAVELYARCIKEINYTRLDKPDREFREWKDNNKERFGFDPFATSLQLQLEYLALSLRAAHAEDVATLFPDLTRFISKLSALQYPPHPILDKNVSATPFADTYNIKDQLSKAEGWADNPLKIGDIYNETILPYLRTEDSQKVDAAWSTRITAEANLAKLYYDFNEKVDEFTKRVDHRRTRDEMRSFVGNKAKDAGTFVTRKRPRLLWLQLVDRFEYQNRAFAARAMLDHINSNISHESAKEWINTMRELVGSKAPSTEAPEAG